MSDDQTKQSNVNKPPLAPEPGKKKSNFFNFMSASGKSVSNPKRIS